MDEFDLLKHDIIFSPKPEPVPYNYRISYKVAQLCLVLFYCCGRKGCSLTKIQIISTSLYTESKRQNLIDFVEGKTCTDVFLRFDPAVNRSVSFAHFYDLIKQQKNGLFRLSEKGKDYSLAIVGAKDLMRDEKDFLEKIKTLLTEDLVQSIASNWGGYTNAEN